MTDVSIVGAMLAGLVSFLSPCVLPLVPGYVSMLSGIGLSNCAKGNILVQVYRLRSGIRRRLLLCVYLFWRSASAVGQFLRENRALLAPVAGALILLFGLHLLGWLAKLTFRVGIILASCSLSLAFFRRCRAVRSLAGSE